MNTHLYEEIRSIEDIINEKKPKKRVSGNLQIEDEYTKLKNKEDKILTLLDDMHKQKDEEKDTLQYFTHAPIHVIIFRTFRKIMSIGNDIIQENDIYKMIDIVLYKDNVIYVGITLVIFSILLMFISL
jgi:hypothetical protein